MPDFIDQSYLFAATAVVLAGLVRGFSGFGSAMIMAPIFSHILGPAQAVAAVILLETIVSAQLVPSAYRHVNWKLLLQLGTGAAIMVPFGVWAVVLVDKDIMRQVFSLVVLVFVIVLATGWTWRGEIKNWMTVLVGGISGLLTGATSMGGPPVILYLLSNASSATQIRSTVILFFLVAGIPTLGSLVYAGAIDTSLMLYVATLAPLFLLAAWVGSRFFRIATEQFFRRLTLGLLTLIAITSLLA